MDHTFASQSSAPAAASPALLEFEKRLLVIAENMRSDLYRLREHTDQVMGSVPETEGEKPHLQRFGGQLGNIETAILSLESTREYLDALVSRATTLV